MNTPVIRRVALIVAAFALTSGCVFTATKMMIPRVEPLDRSAISKPLHKQASFALSKVVANIKRGTVIGRYPMGGIDGIEGTFCNFTGRSLSFLYWDNGSRILGNWGTEFGEVFHDVVSKAGVNIKGDPHDLFKRKKSAQKAEYMIGANITKIASNICRETDVINGGRLNQFSGEFYVDVEWSILSTVTDQVVFKLKTQGYHKQVKQIRNGPLLMFQGAFSNAAQNLVTSAKFVTLAERKSDSAPARSFAGTGLKINFKPETDRPIKSKMAKVLSAVATVRIGGGHGSGFFISNDGYMLTNAHVVGDSKKVGVVLNNGIEVPARVIRKLKSRDIALIKVGLHVPNPLPIRHKPLTRLEQVYAIGTPIEEGLHSTISKGIVSGFRNFNGKKFIQSDTSISPGNSGGPLVDQNGNVVGVSVLKVVTPGAEGLGLFIPISNALSALKIKAK